MLTPPPATDTHVVGPAGATGADDAVGDWIGVSAEPLPVGKAAAWAVRPESGALVLFSGTARNHAPGRPGVTRLEYEAYDEYVVPVMRSIVDRARRRWPDVVRIVLWHRTGEVAIGDSAVVVAVSAPHRPSAFEAARFVIDTVKHEAPIWKREAWAGGEDWGRCEHAPSVLAEQPTP